MRHSDSRSKARPSRRQPPSTELRFPCGHLEPERAAERRMRLRERAVWVPCQRCNVIAVAVCAA